MCFKNKILILENTNANLWFKACNKKRVKRKKDGQNLKKKKFSNVVNLFFTYTLIIVVELMGLPITTSPMFSLIAC